MMDISLTGIQGIFSGLSVVALTLLIIMVFRKLMYKKSKQDLKEKYRNKIWSSPLKSRTKYPDVDGLAYTGPFFRFGLASAMALTLFAFSWTTYEHDVFIPETDFDLGDDDVS